MWGKGLRMKLEGKNTSYTRKPPCALGVFLAQLLRRVMLIQLDCDMPDRQTVVHKKSGITVTAATFTKILKSSEPALNVISKISSAPHSTQGSHLSNVLINSCVGSVLQLSPHDVAHLAYQCFFAVVQLKIGRNVRSNSFPFQLFSDLQDLKGSHHCFRSARYGIGNGRWRRRLIVSGVVVRYRRSCSVGGSDWLDVFQDSASFLF